MKARMHPQIFEILGCEPFQCNAHPQSSEYKAALDKWGEKLRIDVVTDEEDVKQAEDCARQIEAVLWKNRSDSVEMALISFFTKSPTFGASMLRQLLLKIALIVGKDQVRKSCWHLFSDKLAHEDYLDYISSLESDKGGSDFYLKTKQEHDSSTNRTDTSGGTHPDVSLQSDIT